MAATGKPLIPIELLRRSNRLQKSLPTIACDQHAERGQKVQPSIFNVQTTCNKANLRDSLAGDRGPIVKFEKVSRDEAVGGIKMESVINEEKQLHGIAHCSVSDLFKPIIPDGYLKVDSYELDLERTLMGGQSFRWKKLTLPHDDKVASAAEPQPTFQGVVGNNALQLWRCDSDRIAFRKLNKEGLHGKDLEPLLEDYFQLKYKLGDLYRDWSQRDKHFSECSKFYKGFRILRQHPLENVFSFICATNNNIKRISLMIDKMCCRFGDILETKLDDDSTGQSSITNETYRTFPTVERLAQDDVFDSLRYDLGFGYRAKFICGTAKKLLPLSESHNQSPSDYLLSLRNLPYKDTCKQLQSFPGIGRKVADCICLMSMDHLNSVPIDCHIYEIVCRNYMPNLRQERKTLTESVHDLIGNYFTDLHGPLAGWATSVLFIAELKHLKKQTGGDDGVGGKKTKQKGGGKSVDIKKQKKN